MSTVRNTVGLTVGKRIDHIFVRLNRKDNRDQLYLHFDDGTYIEIFGSFQCSSRIYEESVAGLRSTFRAQEDEASFVEYPTIPPETMHTTGGVFRSIAWARALSDSDLLHVASLGRTHHPPSVWALITTEAGRRGIVIPQHEPQ